jgi:hypothetical protein
VRTDQVRRSSGKTARANKKRCDTLSDIAPIRASRSSVKKILLKNSLLHPEGNPPGAPFD